MAATKILRDIICIAANVNDLWSLAGTVATIAVTNTLEL